MLCLKEKHYTRKTGNPREECNQLKWTVQADQAKPLRQERSSRQKGHAEAKVLRWEQAQQV